MQPDDAHTADDLLADFTAAPAADRNQAVLDDVIHILSYLCEKLHRPGRAEHQRRQVAPLLLEGILAILSSVPVTINRSPAFTDIVWCVNSDCTCTSTCGIQSSSSTVMFRLNVCPYYVALHCRIVELLLE